jgi:hypothetical protein
MSPMEGINIPRPGYCGRFRCETSESGVNVKRATKAREVVLGKYVGQAEERQRSARRSPPPRNGPSCEMRVSLPLDQSGDAVTISGRAPERGRSRQSMGNAEPPRVKRIPAGIFQRVRTHVNRL